MMVKHKRGPWSQAEDNFLIQLVHSQGAHNWVRISQLIQSRSPKQCRERYHQNLKPSLNLHPITAEEGILIERMVAEMGKRWAEIARRLHGRSDNAVKNWWNGGMNRRRRLDNRRVDVAPRPAPAFYQHPEVHDIRSVDLAPRPVQVFYQHPETHMQRTVAGLHPRPEDFAPRPDYSVEQRPEFRSSFQQSFPQPLRTSHGSLLAHRRIIESDLPSPSALSSISRTDSDHGAPPSLISDISYASYPQSAQYSPHRNELPPLVSVYQDLGYTSLPHEHLDHNSQHLPANNSDYQVQYSSQPQPCAHYYSNYPRVADQCYARQPTLSPKRQTEVPFGGQLPLPNFHTITLPEQRPASPPSPPRDARMNLSNLLH